MLNHMLHAINHTEAPRLMHRAYKKATGNALEKPEKQLELDRILKERKPG